MKRRFFILHLCICQKNLDFVHKNVTMSAEKNYI